MDINGQAEHEQWDQFEAALASIDAQVGNLRAWVARLREVQGMGRHAERVSSYCPCHGDQETWVSV